MLCPCVHGLLPPHRGRSGDAEEACGFVHSTLLDSSNIYSEGAYLVLVFMENIVLKNIKHHK